MCGELLSECNVVTKTHFNAICIAHSSLDFNTQKKPYIIHKEKHTYLADFNDLTALDHLCTPRRPIFAGSFSYNITIQSNRIFIQCDRMALSLRERRGFAL